VSYCLKVLNMNLQSGRMEEIHCTNQRAF